MVAGKAGLIAFCTAGDVTHTNYVILHSHVTSELGARKQSFDGKYAS